MRLLVTKFREALNTICLVPARAGILPSEFIRLTVGNGFLKMALSAEMFGEITSHASPPMTKPDFDETWTFFADRKLLSAFVNACDDAKDTDEIIFEYTAATTELKIKYKRRRAVLHGIPPVVGYAEDDATTQLSPIVLTDGHKALLKLAAKYAPIDPTAVELNCVFLLNKKAIQASNHVAIFSAQDPTVLLTMPFPLMLPELFTDARIFEILVGDSGARLNFKNDVQCPDYIGYIFQLLNEKCRTDFPTKKIQNYVAESVKLPLQLTFKPADLLTTLRRLEVYTAGGGKSEITVKGKGTAGKKVLVLTSAALQGVFHENISLAEPLVSDVVCEWPLDHLLPYMEYIEAEPKLTVRFDANSPYNFCCLKDNATLDLIVARKTI